MEKYIGLSSCEAEKSRIMYGENIIPENEKMSFWTKYWMNFNNPIITILLVSLGINLIFTFLGKVDWFECVGIFASVIISTFVSTISEYKNENTLYSSRYIYISSVKNVIAKRRNAGINILIYADDNSLFHIFFILSPPNICINNVV